MEKVKLPFSYEGQNEFHCPIFINNSSGLTPSRRKLFVFLNTMMNKDLATYKRMLKVLLGIIKTEELALLIKYYDLTWSDTGNKKIPQFVLIDTQSEAIELMDALQEVEEVLFNEE